MHSIGMDDVASALLITLGLLVAAIIIVGGSVWWLYRVFRNKDEIEEQATKSASEE